MNNLLVSIIIPCYNQAEFLTETLMSIFKQDYTNWECIIVNDGSTDNTEEIASEWQKKDVRFKYYFKINGGLSSARNYGIEKCKGGFIQFLDSDDLLDSRKIKLSIDSLIFNNHSGMNIAISDFIVFINDTKNSFSYGIFKSSDFSLENILYRWDDSFSIPIHCGFFEYSLFTNFRFPEKIKAKEDWIMWVSLFKNGGKVNHIDEPLAMYRKHNNSMTMQKEILPEYIKAYKYLKTIISEEEFNKLSISLFSKYYRKSNKFNKELILIKSSLTYRIGTYTKKRLIKARVIAPLRFLINRLLKFKNINT